MKQLLDFLILPETKISTPRDFLISKCKPLISIIYSDLLNYKKRYSFKSPGYFHDVYKSNGVYIIEFPNKIYVGSTSGETMYFGRRWKDHGKLNLFSLKNLMVETDPEKIIFHAIFRSKSDSVSKFIESGLIAFLSEASPDLLANCSDSSQRKQYKKSVS